MNLKLIKRFKLIDKPKKEAQEALNNNVSGSVQYKVDEAIMMPIENIINPITKAIEDKLKEINKDNQNKKKAKTSKSKPF